MCLCVGFWGVGALKDNSKQVLWAGRLEEKPEAEAFAFQASIAVDQRLVQEDIAGSRAHAAMLAKQGIIPSETAQALDRELERIAGEISNSKIADDALTIDNNAEDIHSFIEGVLTERLGDAGRVVHAGRSRNDQVALDFRLYLKKAIPGLRAELAEAINALLDKAEAHAETLMPGYTHLQRAQPVTLGYHLAAWCCALDRDFALEIASALSIIMIHLSRFCEDIVLWASEEFKFIDLAESYSTGSSIMPQKKNPDFAELIRGKAGRTAGNMVSLLMTLKGLPYAYDKDMQEDKEALFDSIDTAAASLRIFRGMIASAAFNAERMKAACAGGFLEATDAAEYLVRKGMPFRKAHETAALLVRDCIAADLISIGELPLEKLKEKSVLFEEDLYAELKPEACVKKRNISGGPAPEELRRQIRELRKRQ
jgi:argininosuccinate lyase